MSECVDCGRKHSPSKHAAHPADSAEALLREAAEAVSRYSWGLHLAGTPNEQEAIGLIEALRAALQASAPSPAADRIEEARRDLWARIGGAAAEGSEPLDVERLARAILRAYYREETDALPEWQADLNNAVEWYRSPQGMAEDIAAAYASQTSEGTE